MLKGPEAVGALRHRRGERRDRHHHEARQARRGRLRVQQQLPHREGARAARRSSTTYGPSGTIARRLRTFLYFGAPYADRHHVLRQHRRLLPDGADAEAQPVVQRRARRTTGSTTASRRRLDRAGRASFPNTDYNRINLTGASQAQVTRWLNADLSMAYTYANNDQAFKGDDGPLLGLLVWPRPTTRRTGSRRPARARRITTPRGAAEVDNPYFNVNKNKINAKNNRIIANVGLHAHAVLVGQPQDQHRHRQLHEPEPDPAPSRERDSASRTTASSTQATTSRATSTRRRCSTSTRTRSAKSLSISGLLGNAVSDDKSTTDALEGHQTSSIRTSSRSTTRNQRTSRTTIAQRRLVSAFGSATLDFKQLPVPHGHGPQRLDVDDSGRSGTRSSIPSISASFIFSDAFPSHRQSHDGQAARGVRRSRHGRAAVRVSPVARVQDDVDTAATATASPARTSTLKPEFAKSYEFGTELSFLNDRLGLDVDGLPQADAGPDRQRHPRQLRAPASFCST